MQDGVTKIIINSQVSAEGQSEDLKALAKLMNNEPVKLNKHFDYAQRRIKEINEDVAYAEGKKDGVKQGVEQGKVDSAKAILENQLNNGKTLEQATEFVRNLKLISDKKLEKIIDLYK
nr:hypothetical protein [Lactobacillus gasseri]